MISLEKVKQSWKLLDEEIKLNVKSSGKNDAKFGHLCYARGELDCLIKLLEKEQCKLNQIHQ